MFSITGKKAIVTGGSSGIGKACVKILSSNGVDLAVVGRRKDVGEMAAEEAREMGVDAFYVQCDVSDEQQVQQMIKAVIDRFGRLDIAVNSAGVDTESEGIDQPKNDWDKITSVNLTGTWLCAQAEAQQMQRQTPKGGKIINIGSAAAKTARLNAAYCAAKAGVVHLTRSLAMQLGGSNINVNSISPGVLMSPLIAHAPVEFRERVREITPLGYIARPQDIYGPILFLASAASDYVTGHDLLMDGGRTLGTMLEPLERITKPRLSVDDELEELRKELDAQGIAYDENCVTLES
jgi:NAD(P)-dependent dehydrogenase (short-subunit alcohol dehydrogenase family)